MSKTLRNTLVFILMLALLLVAIGWYLLRGDTADYTVDQVSGPAPIIEAPNVERFPTINVAEVDKWQSGEKPVAADGLTVRRFAEGLDHPRNMLLLPNGDVLVAEANSPPRDNKGVEGFIMRYLMNMAGAGVASANRITLLRDVDGDGVADKRTVLLEGLNSPYGMALVGEILYVANTDSVIAYPFKPGQEKITDKGRKVAILSATKPNNHWTRNIVANADGTKLYVAIGSATNIADAGLKVEKDRAAILEIDLATNKKKVYAAGLRNPVGLAWEPNSDELWTVVNERDMLGSDLVPDYLARVDVGTHFGWPWIYWGGYEDYRVKPRRPELREYVRRPDYALGPHVAPIGLSFAKNAALGDRFANGAFVALHGSWNRKPASGYKVVFVPFTDKGRPDVTRDANDKVVDGLPIDVLTGFLSEQDTAKGRPADVAIDSKGALLVTDDVAGIIWRVSNPEAAAGAATAKQKAAAAALASAAVPAAKTGPAN